MKINMFIQRFALLLLLISSVACDDNFLDRQPLDAPSSEVFLSTEEELESAVTAIYTTLWHGGFLGPTLFDYASDNGWDRNASGLQVIGRGEADANNSYSLGYWTAFYQGIARANYIITNSGSLQKEMDRAKYERLLAEARFLRAYYYTYLSELFGAVPLLIRETSLAEAQVARTPKNEVVDFIISELQEISEQLPSNSDEKARATRGTALALLSRIALWNKHYRIAADASEEVMTSEGYSLHPDFQELFRYAGQNSSEILMSIQYLDGVHTHNGPIHYWSRMDLGQSVKVPTQQVIDSYGAIDGMPIDKSPLYDPKNPFKNRDPRLGYTFILPQSRGIRYQFDTNPNVEEVLDYSVDPPVLVKNTEATHPYASFTGYLVRKLTDPQDYPDQVGGGSELNMIIFRYAEVLLNYVEAKVELGEIDTSVYKAINEIRQRPSVGMPAIDSGKSQQEMRSILRKERRSELAMEGFRYFDIRRWNIAAEVMNNPVWGRIPDGYFTDAPKIDENGTPSYDNVRNANRMKVVELRSYDAFKNSLWPIPRIEIQVNPALEQNPGY